jgi:hypothetical protein
MQKHAMVAGNSARQDETISFPLDGLHNHPDESLSRAGTSARKNGSA